jgi:sec-independent protein translocase protein TatA
MLRNGLEPWHVILVVVVVALLFGSKKLPDAARGLGKSMRIFKSEVKAMKSMESVDADDDAARTAPATADAAPSTVTSKASAPTTPRAATEAPEAAGRKSAAAH